MKHRFVRLIAVCFLLSFAVGLVTLPLSAQPRQKVIKKGTVTKVVAIAKPKVFNGRCPATIQFVGTIFVKNPPVTVEYEWLRSDGATGGHQTIEIRSAGQGVYDSWTLGSPKEHLRVWEKVHVISPVNRTSGPATAVVNCK
ncbi:MAG TPA: hypothetical protein VMG09_06500 [Bacteroidota bacterium]|nr:hypothetical protein [Bacteroidota bacterium]